MKCNIEIQRKTAFLFCHLVSCKWKANDIGKEKDFKLWLGNVTEYLLSILGVL